MNTFEKTISIILVLGSLLFATFGMKLDAIMALQYVILLVVVKSLPRGGRK